MSGGGRLIAFEGIDGCGKSTQLGLYAEALAQRAGARPRVLREPGGTALGEALRRLLLGGGEIGARAELLLYMAARAELWEREVLPALGRGETVLLDRSHYSTLAYQGAGLDLPRAEIDALARLVLQGRLPDRVLLFDLSPALAAARLAHRGADRIERRDPAYFERVAAAYRALAAAEPARFVVLDASAAPEVLAQAVQRSLADVA